jgi:hypothetical protein
VRLRLIPVVLIAALAAGCGSSSKNNAAAPPATTTAAATPTTTAAATPTTTASSSGSPSISGLTGDCKKLAELSGKFSQALAAASNASQGNAGAQAKQTAKVFKQFADAAPGSVRPDLETFAAAFEQYASALSGVHLKQGQTPSAADVAKLSQAAQAFSAPKIRAAEAHLQSWAKTNCGAAFATTTG